MVAACEKKIHQIERTWYESWITHRQAEQVRNESTTATSFPFVWWRDRHGLHTMKCTDCTTTRTKCNRQIVTFKFQAGTIILRVVVIWSAVCTLKGKNRASPKTRMSSRNANFHSVKRDKVWLPSLPTATVWAASHIAEFRGGWSRASLPTSNLTGSLPVGPWYKQ